jgi:hypothetical protein
VPDQDQCPIPESPKFLTAHQLWAFRVLAKGIVQTLSAKHTGKWTGGERQLYALCLDVMRIIMPTEEPEEEPDGPEPECVIRSDLD